MECKYKITWIVDDEYFESIQLTYEMALIFKTSIEKQRPEADVQMIPLPASDAAHVELGGEAGGA